MLSRNNHMPDVLDCLANLSNDEVFTPPDIVNKMLDTLPQDVFKRKDTHFLDPFTKSGVFLREITKRLLENQMPDYKKMSAEIDRIERAAIQEAVKTGNLDLKDADYGEKARAIGRDAVRFHDRAHEFHNFEKRLQDELNRIFTTQVFGIAITELTAHVSRRSLYCSKNACGGYSICSDFNVESGNIRFVPMRHTWSKPIKWNSNAKTEGSEKCGAWQGWDEKNEKFVSSSCVWCGASAETLERPDELESHAYEFIHKDVEELKKDLKKEFGEDMFENLVICGNPPYQLNDGGGTGDSAVPIYHKFIEQAQRLNPKFLTMIVPSRWMKGGRGLDKFRSRMMNDKHIVELHDYEDAAMCFPNVHIDGGVNYFLWARDYNGKTDYTFHSRDKTTVRSKRYLTNSLTDNVIRDNRQISIIEKVMDGTERFSSIVSSLRPFGFRTFLFNSPEQYPDADLHLEPYADYLKVYGVKGNKGGAKRIVGYVNPSTVVDTNKNLQKYKLFFSYSYSTDSTVPPEIIVAVPGELCTETFITIGAFDTANEAENCKKYITTKFFRALLMFNRIGIHVSSDTMNLIPLLDFSKSWTDAELYAKYGLTQDEIDFIESMIKPME